MRSPCAKGSVLDLILARATQWVRAETSKKFYPGFVRPEHLCADHTPEDELRGGSHDDFRERG